MATAWTCAKNCPPLSHEIDVINRVGCSKVHCPPSLYLPRLAPIFFLPINKMFKSTDIKADYQQAGHSTCLHYVPKFARTNLHAWATEDFRPVTGISLRLQRRKNFSTIELWRPGLSKESRSIWRQEIPESRTHEVNLH